MNILYISHERGMGGATLALLELIDEMVKKNVKVFVTIGDDKGELYEELLKRDVKIIKSTYYYGMCMGTTPRNMIRCLVNNAINILSAKSLAKIAKDLNINIIHTNSSVLNLGLFISKYTGIPHVFHIREFTENKFRKYVFSKEKSLRLINEYSNKIIVISKALYEENIKYFKKEKLELIYDGISYTYMNSEKRFIETDIFSILIAGTISINKGQIDALLAVSHLVKCGYKNIKLLLAGSGCKEYVEELKELVRKNNIENNVEFLGFKENLNEIRKKVQLELVCSRSEGFGRVTIEAMLSMNPVIGANNTATSELITDKFNGLLYETKNYIQLAEKIKYFIKNPEKIKVMGRNGYKFVAENFNSEKNAKQIYELYRKVLGIT